MRELTKHYGAVVANDSISLDIASGETLGVFGPNGAGKTTLVRQIAGLTKPTSGSVELFGHDVVRRPSEATRLVAMQPQDAISLWNLRVEEAVTFTGRLRGLGREQARRACDFYLDAFELRDRATRLVKRLSGGERRLLTAATTLIGERRMLVFDEPTNDLDPAVRKVLWDLIERRRREGTTLVVVTHNLHEVEHFIDRAVIVHRGRIVAQGSVRELARQYGSVRRIRLPGIAAASLPRLEGATVVEAPSGQVLVDVPEERCTEVLGALLDHWGGAQLPEFSVTRPSLEEIYLDIRTQEQAR